MKRAIAYVIAITLPVLLVTVMCVLAAPAQMDGLPRASDSFLDIREYLQRSEFVPIVQRVVKLEAITKNLKDFQVEAAQKRVSSNEETFAAIAGLTAARNRLQTESDGHTKWLERHQYLIDELERKVAGMQKQITKLNAQHKAEVTPLNSQFQR